MQIVEPSEAKVLKKKAIKEKLLLKGKKLPDGTIRTHGSKKVQKKAGKWVPYREGKKAAKKKAAPSRAFTEKEVLAGEAGDFPKAFVEAHARVALQAMEEKYGTTGLSPEVNDAMIALRRLIPDLYSHRQGPRGESGAKPKKVTSLVKKDADFQDYPAVFNFVDKEATDDFSEQEVTAIGEAIGSASKIAEVEVAGTWEDDHEPCFALQVTVADKDGNQTKIPVSVWWYDPATVYKAEGGSKESQANLLSDLKGDLE
jgi:hypothetical protein